MDYKYVAGICWSGLSSRFEFNQWNFNFAYDPSYADPFINKISFIHHSIKNVLKINFFSWFEWVVLNSNMPTLLAKSTIDVNQ